MLFFQFYSVSFFSALLTVSVCKVQDSLDYALFPSLCPSLFASLRSGGDPETVPADLCLTYDTTLVQFDVPLPLLHPLSRGLHLHPPVLPRRASGWHAGYNFLLENRILLSTAVCKSRYFWPDQTCEHWMARHRAFDVLPSFSYSCPPRPFLAWASAQRWLNFGGIRSPQSHTG